jgi:hypothetical protein
MPSNVEGLCRVRVAASPRRGDRYRDRSRPSPGHGGGPSYGGGNNAKPHEDARIARRACSAHYFQVGSGAEFPLNVGKTCDFRARYFQVGRSASGRLHLRTRLERRPSLWGDRGPVIGSGAIFPFLLMARQVFEHPSRQRPMGESQCGGNKLLGVT